MHQSCIFRKKRSFLTHHYTCIVFGACLLNKQSASFTASKHLLYLILVFIKPFSDSNENLFFLNTWPWMSRGFLFPSRTYHAHFDSRLSSFVTYTEDWSVIITVDPHKQGNRVTIGMTKGSKSWNFFFQFFHRCCQLDVVIRWFPIDWRTCRSAKRMLSKEQINNSRNRLGFRDYELKFYV